MKNNIYFYMFISHIHGTDIGLLLKDNAYNMTGIF